jgi:hypothetical protein
LKGLIDKFARTQAMIDSMAGALRQSPLSAEAAEDPEIVALRVERIARQVSQTLARPPEHPPIHFDDDGPDWDELDESHWDESYKEQRRNQERLHRAVEEQLLAGGDHADALENAMRSEGFIDGPSELDEEDVLGLAAGFEAEPEDEAWRESLPPELPSGDDPFDASEPAEHPLQRLAGDLHMRIFDLLKSSDNRRSSHLDVLTNGVGEIVGGLAQALVSPGTEEDGLDRGLALAQLKRALRGAAFARGALFPLRADALLAQTDFDHLLAAIKQLNDGILAELARIREAREP